MIDKAYNTHLVELWLDNNRDNYMACRDIKKQQLEDDASLLTWLHFREYGRDADKIVLDKDMLYLDAIRQTIKDNMEAIHAQIRPAARRNPRQA